MSKNSNRSMSRADFIKGMGILGAATGASMMFAGCSNNTETLSETGEAVAAPTTDVAWDAEADVIVCGCGTAGAPAAIEAFDAGSDVLVIEKMDWLGGCMRRCAGGFYAAGTSVQEKLGIDDNPDMMFEYISACAGDYGDPDLIRVWSDNSAKDFEWIITDLGGQPLDEWDFVKPENNDKGESIYIAPGLNQSGTPVYYDDYDLQSVSRPRCHWFKPNPEDTDPGDRMYSDYSTTGLGEGLGGTGLWKPFEDALESRGINVQTETELAGLIQNDEGEVIGVKVISDGEEKRYKAKQGVVIATGGFANNVDLFENFTGNKYEEPTKVAMTNGGYILDEADGAGVKAALAAGAAPRNIFLGNSGGIRINTDAQVIDTNGDPIPRLFASSRAVGGMFSSVYPACGTFVSSAFCFGRIAGKSVSSLDRLDS